MRQRLRKHVPGLVAALLLGASTMAFGQCVDDAEFVGATCTDEISQTGYYDSPIFPGETKTIERKDLSFNWPVCELDECACEFTGSVRTVTMNDTTLHLYVCLQSPGKRWHYRAGVLWFGRIYKHTTNKEGADPCYGWETEGVQVYWESVTLPRLAPPPVWPDKCLE